MVIGDNSGIVEAEVWDKSSPEYRKGVMKLRKWHEQCAKRRKEERLRKLKLEASARKACVKNNKNTKKKA